MNWTNLLWLGLGFGMGLAVYWRRQVPAPVAAVPSVTPHTTLPNEAEPPDPKQLQLAYHLATEMSQFKGGFLARISHELRSPLNGLIGMHQLILAGLCDNPQEEREFLAQANTSAQRMVGMIDQMLAVARLQHGTAQLNLQPISLATVLQETYDLTHIQASDRNLHLNLNLPNADVYVLADQKRLSQVLLHLVDRAIRRLPAGTITISAEVLPKSSYATVWIEDQQTAGDRSEPVDYLQSTLSKEDILPSPGLTLLADQIILQLMQAQLEVVPVDSANHESDSLTRLQCRLLLAPEQGT